METVWGCIRMCFRRIMWLWPHKPTGQKWLVGSFVFGFAGGLPRSNLKQTGPDAFFRKEAAVSVDKKGASG